MATRYFKSGDTEINETSGDAIQITDESSENVGKKTKVKKFPKKKDDPYPGEAPVSEEKRKSYVRGAKNETSDVQNLKLKSKLKSQEKKFKSAADQATRYELLLTEEPGFLQPDEDEETYDITQQDIRKHVDVASGHKHFELNLDQFGPYRISYTRNGRYLLLGGSRGHVAAFDWSAKKLMCEMNVMEKVNDVKWLHTENMFAVAQKQWVYIYDNQGIELHCLKNMNNALRLEYLPYHFLLVASSRNGFLHYLDISIGKIISSFPTRGGRLCVLSQNPYNATILLGHHNGNLTMWSPMSKEPLVKMLCHKSAIRAVAVDKTGLYMATAGQDNRMKIFDIRMFRPVHAYNLRTGHSNLAFSQQGLLAATCNNIVEIYKDPCTSFPDKPYLVHNFRHPVNDIKFCPYEDVLGVGRHNGFESLLIPGAGEANYDSLESNPYRSKYQRREWEVKALLEKIQPDMISLDPFMVGNVDYAKAEQIKADREQRMGFKEEETKFVPKFKKKGRSSAGNIQKRKQVMKNKEVREISKMAMKRKQDPNESDLNIVVESNVNLQSETSTSALSRFKRR